MSNRKIERRGASWTHLKSPRKPGRGIGSAPGRFVHAAKERARSVAVHLLLGVLLGLLIGVPFAVAAPGDAPEVTTPNVAEIKVTSAAFIGEVNPNALETTYRFEYRQPGDPDWISVPEVGESAGDGTDLATVAQQVVGLEADTQYEVRLVATNSTGTTMSGEATFQTLAALPPEVTTPTVSDITLTAASFAGEVDPNGLETTYRFEYQQPGDADWISVPDGGESAGDGTEPDTVAQQADGLEPDTQYNVRLVGTNSAGTTTSSAATFQTLPELPPEVTSPIVSQITPTGASFDGTVSPNGSTTLYRFEYQQPGDPDWTSTGENEVDGTEDVSVNGSAEGLAPGAEYLVRLVATNDFGTATSDSVTFETEPEAPPALTPLSAQAVTATGATLRGEINPNGLAASYRFEYGTTTSYGSSVPVPDGQLEAGGTPITVEHVISGLQAKTTYHFRIVATSDAGTTNGSDQTFTTLPNAPVISAVVASAISSTGATLAGTVNPNGGGTTYRFQYGTSTAYGQNVPVPNGNVGSGTTAVPVSAAIAGLQPNTTYHFRLVAANGGGTTTGPDQTFTTSGVEPPPPPPPPPTTPPTTTTPLPTPSEGRAEVSSSARVKAGSAQIRLSCGGGAGGPCEGRLKLTAKLKVGKGGKARKVGIGSASFALGVGEAKAIKVKLSRAATKALSKSGKVKVTISGTGLKARTVTLNAPKKGG